jgi:hypothetical protein
VFLLATSKALRLDNIHLKHSDVRFPFTGIFPHIAV